jgi:hypothetical protein
MKPVSLTVQICQITEFEFWPTNQTVLPVSTKIGETVPTSFIGSNDIVNLALTCSKKKIEYETVTP